MLFRCCMLCDVDVDVNHALVERNVGVSLFLLVSDMDVNLTVSRKVFESTVRLCGIHPCRLRRTNCLSSRGRFGV